LVRDISLAVVFEVINFVVFNGVPIISEHIFRALAALLLVFTKIIFFLISIACDFVCDFRFIVFSARGWARVSF
jgi:hypothetical protein